MHFSRSLAVLSILVSTSSVLGHSIINPALGVTGTPARSDVQRPSAAKPCGNTALTALTSSTPVTASGNTFTVAVQDFNAGADGSRSVTAQVDPTGKGTSFTAATVTKNGDPAPKTVGTDQVTVSLPAGTTCAGGSDGKTCLVAFKTTAGFGNCVAVTQGAGGAAAGGAAAGGAAAGAAAAGNSTGTAAGGAAVAGGAAAGAGAAGAAAGKGAGKAKGAGAAGAGTAAGAGAGAAGAGAGAAGAGAAAEGAAGKAKGAKGAAAGAGAGAANGAAKGAAAGGAAAKGAAAGAGAAKGAAAGAGAAKGAAAGGAAAKGAAAGAGAVKGAAAGGAAAKGAAAGGAAAGGAAAANAASVRAARERHPRAFAEHLVAERRDASWGLWSPLARE